MNAKKRLLVPRFLFVVCFAAGACGISFVFDSLAVGLRTYTWETSEGTIAKAGSQIHDRTTTEQETPDSKTTTIGLAFDYSVSGQRFQGSSLNVEETLSDSQWSNSNLRLRRLLETYPVGARVPVYYDPNDPGKAVLERGVPVLQLAFWFIFSSMFLFPAWIINNAYRPFSWVGDAACLPITWGLNFVGYVLLGRPQKAKAVVSELRDIEHVETVAFMPSGERVSVSDDSSGCAMGCGLVTFLLLSLLTFAFIDYFSDRLFALIDHFSDRPNVLLVEGFAAVVIGAIAWRAASSYRLAHPSRDFVFDWRSRVLTVRIGATREDGTYRYQKKSEFTVPFDVLPPLYLTAIKQDDAGYRSKIALSVDGKDYTLLTSTKSRHTEESARGQLAPFAERLASALNIEVVHGETAKPGHAAGETEDTPEGDWKIKEFADAVTDQNGEVEIHEGRLYNLNLVSCESSMQLQFLERCVKDELDLGQLESLFLQEVSLSDEWLLTISRLSGLQMLGLWGCDIDGDKLKLLTPLASTLTFLDLSGNSQLSHFDTDTLASFTSLRQLGLRATRFNDGTTQDLKRRLPECDVEIS
jgi:hypothetical protein